MARPRLAVNPADIERARRLLARGDSLRDVAAVVGIERRSLRRLLEESDDQVDDDGGRRDLELEPPVVSIPGPRPTPAAETRPVHVPIGNLYSRAFLDVSRFVREHGCCRCGEVPANGRTTLDVPEHLGCSGLVKRSLDGLHWGPA